MPARVNKIRHDESVRLKIKVGRIIDELHRHYFGERDMSATQLAAAKILLAKAIPDLQAVEISGEISTSKVIRAPAVANTSQSWSDQYVPPEHTEH